MNKRGFLLGEEALKIIISVIVLLFLAFLLFSIYNANKKDKNLELAEASLKYLQDEINAGASEVEVYNPSGLEWNFYSFLLDKLPNSCLAAGWKSCICICKDEAPLATGGKSMQEKCDDHGRCIESEYQIRSGNYNFLGITNPPLSLSIDHGTKTITEKNGP